MREQAIEPSLIIGQQTKSLFIELWDFDDISNLSNASFRIFFSLFKEFGYIGFEANNDIVKVFSTNKLPDWKRADNLIAALKAHDDEDPFVMIDLTKDPNFEGFINQSIESIQLEQYDDGEQVGFKVILSNGATFEVYPNAYGTSGHFYGVDMYFPVKNKYLADKTSWVTL